LLAGNDATNSENLPLLADVRKQGLSFFTSLNNALLWPQIGFKELETSLREARDLGEKITLAKTLRKGLAVASWLSRKPIALG
jgi:hypothetical protein